MEKKDTEHTPGQINISNSVNNSGFNFGNMGNTININSGQKPQVGDLPSNSPETTMWKANVVKLVSEGRAEEALAEIMKASPRDDIRMQVAMIGGRYSQWRIGKIAGVLDRETEVKELNSIHDAILTLVSRF